MLFNLLSTHLFKTKSSYVICEWTPNSIQKRDYADLNCVTIVECTGNSITNVPKGRL